ncbi:MAG TPA: hypothetical protein VLK23_15410 [Thermodesulfobacteriota bacterium]|nr:hypothetical protein [Thermodesulfobacteriota bacterium]
MDRKIIIKAKDLDKEIHSFLTQVGADIPIKWPNNALALIRGAVIEAYGKMGITLEVDECLPKRFITALSTSNRSGTVS